MATSIVARTSTTSSTMSLLSGLALFVALVAGQSVQPSNATLPASEGIFTQLTIINGPSHAQTVFNIAPLTPEVGMGGSQGAVAVCTSLSPRALIKS